MIKYLDSRIKKRYEIANMYNYHLSKYVKCPEINFEGRHSLYTYAIRAKKRNQLMNFLNRRGIETKIYHRPLVSESPFFKKFKPNFTKNAKKILNEILSIPSSEKLKLKEQKYVIKSIKEFYER
jgi:dTDP-4-amino-4,6-dideoxygalactose transaminase